MAPKDWAEYQQKLKAIQSESHQTVIQPTKPTALISATKPLEDESSQNVKKRLSYKQLMKLASQSTEDDFRLIKKTERPAVIVKQIKRGPVMKPTNAGGVSDVKRGNTGSPVTFKSKIDTSNGISIPARSYKMSTAPSRTPKASIFGQRMNKKNKVDVPNNLMLLRKEKRDMPAIEDLQNEIHAKKMALNKTRPESQGNSMAKKQKMAADVPIQQKPKPSNRNPYSYGSNMARYDDYDDEEDYDSSDMEAGFETLAREEMRRLLSLFHVSISKKY